MIRIFIGCASGDDVESQAVLEYTLRKHSSAPLQITWMRQTRDPESPFFTGGNTGWNTKKWSTPFSAFRWSIPEQCEFQGQAIYMDSDMIVMDDIAKLWAQPFQPGKVMMAKPDADHWRFCVLKMDCEKIRKFLPPMAEIRAKPNNHNRLRKQFRQSDVVQEFSGNWNCVDGEDYETLSHPDIKIIHYSGENTQPQLKYAVPRLALSGRHHWFDGKPAVHWRKDLIALFDGLLEEAKAAGFDPRNYEPQIPFGEYQLKSHENYKGNRWTKAHTLTGMDDPHDAVK
jgi:hypothetical protein